MESQQELQEQRRPYICEIVISFPTARHAEQVKQVLEVDREVGAEDRIVHKSFAIQNGGGASPQNNNKNELTVYVGEDSIPNKSSSSKQEKIDVRAMKLGRLMTAN